MLDKKSLVFPKGNAILIKNGNISSIDQNDVILDEFIPWYDEGDKQKMGIILLMLAVKQLFQD